MTGSSFRRDRVRTLGELPLEHSRVLVRADLDVDCDANGACDDYRLRTLLPTLRAVHARAGQSIILGHRGRPRGYDPAFSLEPVARTLARISGEPFTFMNPWHYSDRYQRIRAMREPYIVLENLRFQLGERNNDGAFASDLARYAQYYIDDAFGNSHRAHASMVQLPLLLPGAIGSHFLTEMEVLTRLAENPERPLTIILGGMKWETKLPVIRRFLSIADHILVGGALANILLHTLGYGVGTSLGAYPKDFDTSGIDLTSRKMHLPIDVVARTDGMQNIPGEIRSVAGVQSSEFIYDIGPDTRELYGDIIARARTLIWNGVMGYNEDVLFRGGTDAIARAIADSPAYTVVGGGSVIAAITMLGLFDTIDHVSTGGGALLTYLAGESLPALEALAVSRQTFPL